MGALSLLGKSKTARGLILGLSLYAAAEADFPELANTALAQGNSAKIEHLQKEFAPKPLEKSLKYERVGLGSLLRSGDFIQAGAFPGVMIKVNPLSNRLYRHEETVWSVPEHSLNLYLKAGYEFRVKNEFRDTDPAVKGKSDVEQGRYFFKKEMEPTIGTCSSGSFEENGIKYVFSVPFYRRTTPLADVFVHAHEDWHAAQLLECNECYRELDKRLRRHGYNILFSDFDMEEQAEMAAISVIMDEKLPLETFINKWEDTLKVYNKMQDYRIPSFISELYKPGRTNR
ncbi:MAG: hypothetical protein MUP55_00150 [Candidatus Aenigmarchaeota archaeon]|nr:hypothetical protein [Candidatus Aenigmarchaeota archaeon]